VDENLDRDDWVWEVELEGDRKLSVEREGNQVMVWQPQGDMRPLHLTRSEALALAEALRRQAELLKPERQ
jgi:hypothetical protein